MPLTHAMDLFRQASWLHLSQAIHRYLIVNSDGRLDGAEKAMRHMELCQFYVAVVRQLDNALDARRGAGEADYQKVHTATQALTDNLDEVIGFPLKGRPDYDELAPLFFEHFHRLAMEALQADE